MVDNLWIIVCNIYGNHVVPLLPYLTFSVCYYATIQQLIIHTLRSCLMAGTCLSGRAYMTVNYTVKIWTPFST
jgi:hypothetical protein